MKELCTFFKRQKWLTQQRFCEKFHCGKKEGRLAADNRVAAAYFEIPTITVPLRVTKIAPLKINKSRLP